ncbi:hypothetical protein SPHV1_320060 [Novosphingobium sp. KN65.2]|nr:hypothetical protein SPHV1_320060 [Novosphingobium sp. KN65.2]
MHPPGIVKAGAFESLGRSAAVHEVIRIDLAIAERARLVEHGPHGLCRIAAAAEARDDPVAHLDAVAFAGKADAAHQFRALGGTQVHDEMGQARIARTFEKLAHFSGRARKGRDEGVLLDVVVLEHLEQILKVFGPSGS